MLSNGNSRDPVILSAVRTPMGKFQGALAPLPATELGAIAIRGAVEKAGIDASLVEEVILGHVLAAGTGQAPGRQAALHGGLPDTVGAATMNKVCGSGLKAVMTVASAIRAGDGDVFVAGGMESMSNAPYLLPKARNGYRYGHAEMLDSIVSDGLWCQFENWLMGDAAERIADAYEVTREEMDEFALSSHQKAVAAMNSGAFRDEIVPVRYPGRKGQTVIVDADETPRPDTSMEALARLQPVFRPNGRVTAGNAPGLNDGAAALVITSRDKAAQLGIRPIARIVGYTHAAVDPEWIFIAPARAIPRLLQRTGMTLADVDRIELNEAFAAQVLADGRALESQGWDWDKVNLRGGAIALGHPLGASGARVLTTLLHILRDQGLHRGIASLCLGGGEAVALMVEMEG